MSFLKPSVKWKHRHKHQRKSHPLAQRLRHEHQLMSFSADDHRFMAQALLLAQRGMNTTTPNPRVGCVIVKEGQIISEGWHEKTGGPHAEAVALANLTANLTTSLSTSAAGATVYVTLEPCRERSAVP